MCVSMDVSLVMSAMKASILLLSSLNQYIITRFPFPSLTSIRMQMHFKFHFICKSFLSFSLQSSDYSVLLSNNFFAIASHLWVLAQSRDYDLLLTVCMTYIGKRDDQCIDVSLPNY